MVEAAVNNNDVGARGIQEVFSAPELEGFLINPTAWKIRAHPSTIKGMVPTEVQEHSRRT